MSDTANTGLDHRGAFAQPNYINDMQPTTRFHPSELPADPEAIRRFPKHLIDVNHVTESPSGDASPDTRLERARQSFTENAHRFGGVTKMRNFLRELAGEDPVEEELEPAPEAVEPVAESEPETPAEAPSAEGESAPASE